MQWILYEFRTLTLKWKEKKTIFCYTAHIMQFIEINSSCITQNTQDMAMYSMRYDSLLWIIFYSYYTCWHGLKHGINTNKIKYLQLKQEK